MKHTNRNPDFFDRDKIFSDYITNHNKKIDLYLVKCVFQLAFNNFFPHIKTEFEYNTSLINLKISLLYWIKFFSKRLKVFSY